MRIFPGCRSLELVSKPVRAGGGVARFDNSQNVKMNLRRRPVIVCRNARSFLNQKADLPLFFGSAESSGGVFGFFLFSSFRQVPAILLPRRTRRRDRRDAAGNSGALAAEQSSPGQQESTRLAGKVKWWRRGQSNSSYNQLILN